MSAKKIFEQAKRLSDRLAKVVAAKGTLDALGAGKGKPSEDFVYEVYVDLRILFELKRHPGWTLDVRNSKAKKGLHFPRKPGNKANHSFFAVVDKNGADLFQVCFGVKYSDGSKTFAPDVTFQTPNATLAPGSADIVFCIDQKYTMKANKSMSRDEIFKFRGALERLFKPQGTLSVVVFGPSSVFADRNTIVTNAGPSELTDTHLASIEIAEIHGFAPGKKGVRRG